MGRFAFALFGHLSLVAVAGLLRRGPRSAAAGRGSTRPPDRLGSGEDALPASGSPPNDGDPRRRRRGGRHRRLAWRRGPDRHAAAVAEVRAADRVVVGVRQVEVVEAGSHERRRRLVGAARSTLDRRCPPNDRQVLAPAEPSPSTVSPHHARRPGNTTALLQTKSSAEHDHDRIMNKQAVEQRP